jgi:hypothetical protein
VSEYSQPAGRDSLCLGRFRDGVRAHLAAVHHESEAREVLFEQPCSELEISERLEEESCVVSVQPLAKREGGRGVPERLPLAPVPVETKLISEQARTERTQSEHARPPDPAATTWSQRLRSRG